MSEILKTTWQSGMHFVADAPGGTLNLDAHENIGGKEKGNRPKALMLAALAGCTGIDVVLMLQKMRVELAEFKIDVVAELSDEHPKIYKTTHIIYQFTGANSDYEKMEKAVNMSFDKYCGVVAMFKSFSTVTKEIKFN